MPLPMHEARLAMARAAGIDPAELPFVAELLDVLPGEERWRTAIESVLAPVARTLLQTVLTRHLVARADVSSVPGVAGRASWEQDAPSGARRSESSDEVVEGEIIDED